jgi:hypothetical protein
MRPALKLNDIEQEHLQEVYDAAGIPRDVLPYTDAFTKLCQDFQDRVFKNADPQQVYGGLVRYTRVGARKPMEAVAPDLSPEQAKQLKVILRKHGQGGRLLPYSDEFDEAVAEFNKITGLSLSQRDFWLAIARSQPRPRPPTARRVVVEVEEDGE